MAQRFSIAQIFLWLFVIVLGIVLGGGLYEQLVVMPLWSLTPPDSVVAYHQHKVAYPQFAMNPGGRFWMFFMPSAGLLAIATIISGLKTRPEHRKWRLLAAILALIVVVFTIAWFVPNIIKLNRNIQHWYTTQLSTFQQQSVQLLPHRLPADSRFPTAYSATDHYA